MSRRFRQADIEPFPTYLAFEAIKIDQRGDVVLVELTASVSDRAATFRMAREMLREDGWVRENLRDATFELAVRSSDAPCPIDMGHEIDALDKWEPLLAHFSQP